MFKKKKNPLMDHSKRVEFESRLKQSFSSRLLYQGSVVFEGECIETILKMGLTRKTKYARDMLQGIVGKPYVGEGSVFGSVIEEYRGVGLYRYTDNLVKYRIRPVIMVQY